MERLPSTEFGRTLRALAREEYGNQAAYARRLSIDPSRITQLVRGLDERPTYPLIETLMGGFALAESKQRLYEAWLASYAPSPLDQATPEPWDSDEQIQHFAWQMYVLVPAGRSLSVFQSLQRLWRALEPDPRRFRSALLVGRTLCEISYDLDRPLVGFGVSQRMLRIAQSASDAEWMAMSWWLESLAVRLSYPDQIDRADRLLGHLASFLSDWNPTGVGKSKRAEMIQAVKRDAVLIGWTAESQRKESAQSMIGHRVQPLQDSIPSLENPLSVGLAYEAVARAQLLVGSFDDAAESLAAGQAAMGNASPQNQLKFLISELRLRLATNEHRHLWDRYSAGLDLADAHGLVHYRHRLRGLQLDIERVAG